MLKEEGSEAQELLEKDRRYIIHGIGKTSIILTKGKGALVWDVTGKEYIDCFSQTAGVLGVGHCHPKVVRAIKDQAEKLAHTLPSIINIPKVELAEKLTKIMPSKLSKYFFVSGGSEAVETALKGAMRITGKKEVISLYFGYHGGTIACLSLGQPWHREGYPTVPGFRQIPPPYCYRCFYGKTYPECDFECARALEGAIEYGTYNNVAAFVAEPIQGSGGHVLPPDKEYFKIVRETCDEHDVLLIDDEVQTGFGRTGKMWGCEYFDFQPDIMTISKAMGGGVPIGAAVFREDILPEDFEEKFWHIFTFGGGPLGCAAASAVVDVIVDEDLPNQAAKTGKSMTARLMDMRDERRLIGDIRGPGLFIGVELVRDRKTKEKATDEAVMVIEKCYEGGAIFGLSMMPGFGNVIKIKPPLLISEEQADRALDVLNAVLSDWK